MASFDFTQISSSNQLDGRFANPSINDAGTVTYEGFQGVCTAVAGDCLQTGTNTPPNALYKTKSDGSTTKVIDRSSYSDFSGYNSGVFFSGATNNADTTVLAASGFNYGQLIAGGPSAVLSSTGSGPINNVAYSGTPFLVTLIDPLAGFATSNLAAAGNFDTAPGVNDAGTVAYIEGRNLTTTLYTKSTSGALTTIADTSLFSKFQDFYLGGVNVGRGAGPFAAYTLPAINENGTVAFNADYKLGLGKGIFTGNGGATTTIADTTSGMFTKFTVPSLNNSGTVAFGAGLADGSSAIYTSKDGKLTTVADTKGLFKDLTKSDVSLNQKGQLAFLAELDDGTIGIFKGPNPLTDKVIGVGDKLGDYTVQNLFISHDGLNDLGQLAFDATVVDAYGNVTEQIFRGDDLTPVPEPSSSVPLLGVAILGMVGYRWRRRKQSAKLVRQGASHFGKDTSGREDRTVSQPEMSMTPEAAEQLRLQAIAEILYRNIPSGELTSVDSIKTAVRELDSQDLFSTTPEAAKQLQVRL